MTTVQQDLLLARSAFQARINAPVDKVDIGTWLLGIPDAEYQRCAPPDHIAAGYTTTDDGRPMSINVEKVGDSLIIEHYVGEIVEPLHVKMVSISDVFAEDGTRTNMQVTWELTAEPDGDGLTFTNEVVVRPTDDFLAFLDSAGLTLEQAAAAHATASARHNALETPRFAASIERAALKSAVPAGR
ncbi:hypothetical protein [Mycolicibacterium helvum]|uniref:Polyketide cyclase n=1 Tax=Mycolicibacterium helvum TaxID=1534349 RepID=A0A7I7SYM0_9MYCO|nr:hypothetical protein [Mycolicibacterium helvum]BBY62122.1 hypothetical protein MHEL_03650 [Mycolicibacterium helvum]